MFGAASIGDRLRITLALRSDVCSMSAEELLSEVPTAISELRRSVCADARRPR